MFQVMYLWVFVCLSFIIAQPAIASENSGAAEHALALIAPEGRWVVQLETRQTDYDKQFNASKNVEVLGALFDQVNLDSNIFPALALLGPATSLGTTLLTTGVQIQRTQLTLGYGLTDDITIGIIATHSKSKTNVDFSVLGGNTGMNPLFNPTLPLGPTNFPFVPSGAGIPAATTADIQSILTSPVFGFEYEPIQNTSSSEMGDVTLGGLWRFYEDEQQSFVFGAAYRRGLAADDNPDNLFDVPGNDGSNDAFAQLEYFRNMGLGVDFHAKIVRTWQFSDTVNKRIPTLGQVLATASSKEDLERNLGDFWEYDIELGKALGNWRMGATWHRYVKSQDSYTSSIGSNTDSLNAQTDIFADQWRISISWSGIQAWQDKQIPLPLIAKLEIQQTAKGRNIPKLFDAYLLLTTFF